MIKSVKSFEVRLVSRNDIKNFIETWHYSKSINGCIADYCFGLYDDDVMIGAMFYGKMAMRNQYKPYAVNEKDVLELRRLCCIDDTPRNTESYFIGKTLRILSKITDVKVIVSYADKEYGHSGVIYKASNFVLVNEIKGARVILYNGKQYHDKTIRTTYKCVLKPFAQRIKDALENGEAIYKNTLGKFVYVYKLR